MKKLLSAILTLSLALSLSATAFAADKTVTPIKNKPKPISGGTSVTFNVDPTYTVTIPETVELDMVENNGVVTYEKDADITADAGVRLHEREEIKVTLDSDFELKTNEDAAYTLPYTVTVGQYSITSGDEVARFGTSLDEQTSRLHFAAENPQYAGEYKDTVVFNICIMTIIK